MGTNYYKRIPLNKEQKEVLHKMIDNNQFDIDEYGNINFNYSEELDKLHFNPTEVHIGKRSAGWKFLFESHNWKYFNNRDGHSIIKWIKDTSDGSIIIDENGEVISPEELIEIIETSYDKDYKGGELWDSKTYSASHPHCYSGEDYEVYVGKYRVSTAGSFS